ncbi:hypothetical protein OO007_14015 [Cocleimonas sp. KMM 6892]|uniref:hypothetical protein n=1 Tax=unclassified Cocleimonas TaxID=2639732 RepID=UPI002DBA1686|nr:MULTISPECIES: hypothetical protein [unclassified Cocleimonas]MEB8433351.1 hypothetical protein [Cocleimonas sp. KMM 6892]MEC4716162.1 hypothetical protein [Cocleimonas sp. KMM 6895]MEC4745945.1 hypothetical protein [Cocleimonas sp. KMM 6896]
MRFIKLSFILCLVSLFFIVSVSTDTFVSNDEHASVHKYYIPDVVDFDDSPDLAPAPQTNSHLVVNVFSIGLFAVLQKAILKVKKTLYIRGPPIF